MKININSTITLHFELSLKDGTVVETTRVKNKPAILKIGDGKLPKSFEDKLLGLQIGDIKKFFIACDDAFGKLDLDKIQNILKEKFKDNQELSKGSVVVFETEKKASLVGVVKDLDEGNVVVNFNSPLAGHDIYFEVEILNVENNE